MTDVPQHSLRAPARTLTVQGLAEHKRLPTSFLRQLGLHDLPNDLGVGIPYFDDSGMQLLVKRRTTLKAGDGSYWPKGKALCAYGQQRLHDARHVGMLILVEGESDCWTLWHHSLPALGLPGSNTARTLTSEHRAGVQKIYIHVERDAGGAAFRAGVSKRLAELGFDGQVFIMQLPEGIKDPSELHMIDPEKCAGRLKQALADASLDAHTTTPPSRNHGGVAACGVANGTLQTCPTEKAEPALLSVNLADVPIEKVDWLWPGRIPLGKVTILDGDPGLGKSSLTLDLAARLTKGLPLPFAAPESALPPSHVLVVTTEDGLGDTIRPRLEAAGAHIAGVTALKGLAGPDNDVWPITLPRDTRRIEDMAWQTGARLIIIDPLMAFLDESVNTYSDQNVRRALLPLAQLAEVTGAAVVVVRHLNKQPGRNALYRGGGSIGIIGAARSGLLIAKDPDAPHQCILGVTKCNLCKPPRAVRFELVSAEQAPRVMWLSESDESIDDVLTPDAETPMMSPAEFLQTRLAEGEAAMKELLAEAQDLGISKRTLERAKARLGIVSDQRRTADGKRHWVWGLPREAA